jgi:hypothetical protein
MSTHELKVGDRVRVTDQCRVPGCQPGEKGAVDGLSFYRGPRRAYYAVRLDKKGPDALAVLFAADEIEPDV